MKQKDSNTQMPPPKLNAWFAKLASMNQAHVSQMSTHYNFNFEAMSTPHQFAAIPMSDNPPQSTQ